ncbi:antA/AntB antirepressor family protein [Enterobacter pseudoroggenkampii]|uniref:antA/AntB antirepressor family protein n=1 Tax=Enterobacter pseudoroggenkampii TaxID=2996112 RepID=UPI00226430A7|nr:antA/AntB antirepressor family protein [Enterobacter pseudoroggenkampii]MCX8289080.1 antA/AntB antirepressor family protein [Enterobacter pseudoroggenkampii]
MSKLHSYEQEALKVSPEFMVAQLEMTPEQAQKVFAYRERFKLLLGEDGKLVNLAELWEILGQPYTKFSVWLVQVVEPLTQRLKVEISSIRQKRKGRYGQPKVDHFVDLDTAKHLALAVNNKAGDEVRDYFITVEKLTQGIMCYNAVRVKLHDNQKRFYYLNLQRRKFDKVAANRDIKDLNYLIKRASGGRNEIGTDYDLHQASQIVYSNLMLKGKSFDALRNLL